MEGAHWQRPLAPALVVFKFGKHRIDIRCDVAMTLPKAGDFYYIYGEIVYP